MRIFAHEVVNDSFAELYGDQHISLLITHVGAHGSSCVGYLQ